MAQYLTIILIVFGAWLFLLSVLFFLIVRHYQRLVRGAKSRDLKGVLDKILDGLAKNSKNINGLEKQIQLIKEEGAGHVQRVGLVRFNPFSQTGGDHSFSLALLDGKETGVIITALHTRERTRVYLKPLQAGKSRFELSNEERRALKEALKK